MREPIPDDPPPFEPFAVARSGRELFVVDPAAPTGPPSEAFLPTEMDFALTALWQVSRPGPWMALYDLRSQ